MIASASTKSNTVPASGSSAMSSGIPNGAAVVAPNGAATRNWLG